MASHQFLCLRFKVIYETTKVDQDIRVVGNIKELGNWSPLKAVPLSCSQIERNVWSSAEVVINKIKLPFKNVEADEEKLLSSENSTSNNDSYLSNEFLKSKFLTNKKEQLMKAAIPTKNSVHQYSRKQSEKRRQAYPQPKLYDKKRFKMEYKYVIFQNGIFSHWESLPGNQNHVIDLELIFSSHVILVNNKFSPDTCIESGTKFRTSIVKTEMIFEELEEMMANSTTLYDFENYNECLNYYLSDQIDYKDFNGLKLVNSNKSEYFPAYFKDTPMKEPEIQPFPDKLNRFKDEAPVKRKLSDLGIIGEVPFSSAREFHDTSFIFNKFKINTQSIYKEILSKENVIITSIFLPCQIFVDEASIVYIDSCIDEVCSCERSDACLCESPKIKKKIDIWSIKLGVTFTDDSFYSVLYSLVKKHNKERDVFSWVGCLPNYFEITEKLGLKANCPQDENEDSDIVILNSKIEDLLKEYQMSMVKVCHDTLKKFKKMISCIIEPMINYITFLEDDNCFKKYSEYYEAYKSINHHFAEKIHSISGEGTFVLVQNYHLFLVPSYLQSYSINFKIAFWLHSNFPSGDVFRTFPDRADILRSILKCNIIGFHTYSSSRNFMISVKSILQINYTSNHQGHIIFSIHGRNVYLVVQTITSDKEQIEKIMKTKEFAQLDNSIKKMIGDANYVWVGIDPQIYLSGVKHKLSVFKKFLEELKEKHPKFLYLQYLYETEELMSYDEKTILTQSIKSVNELAKEINLKFKKEIVIIKTKKISYVEKLALLANTNCFMKIMKLEPFNLDVYDYLVVKQIYLETLYSSNEKHTTYFLQNKKNNNLRLQVTNDIKNGVISFSSTGNASAHSGRDRIDLKTMIATLKSNPKLMFYLVLSESHEATNALNSSFRTNLFYMNQLENIMFLVNEKQITPKDSDIINICNDMRNCQKNSMSTWLMSWTTLLDQITIKGEKILKKGVGLNMDIVNTPNDFTHLNFEDVILKYSNTSLRLIIINPEGSLISMRNPSHPFGCYSWEEDERYDSDNFYYPFQKAVSKLKVLSQDRKNILIILSSRSREELDRWFESLDNAILIAESGYYTKFKSKPNCGLSFKKQIAVKDDEWTEFFDNYDFSWLEEVAYQLKPYVERCEGSILVQNETSLVWDYKNCDHQQATAFVGAIYNEFEQQLKLVNVTISNNNEKLVFRPEISCKESYINYFLSTLQENYNSPEIILYLGDSSDEQAFKSVSKFGTQSHTSSVFTIVVSEKHSNANFYLDDRKEAYLVLKAISRISVPDQKSNYAETHIMKLSSKDYLRKRSKSVNLIGLMNNTLIERFVNECGLEND